MLAPGYCALQVEEEGIAESACKKPRRSDCGRWDDPIGAPIESFTAGWGLVVGLHEARRIEQY